MARSSTPEGIPVGISSWSTLGSNQSHSREKNRGKQIIVIIPSFAGRYLSTALFAEPESK